MLVFVYGTLRRGAVNEASSFVGAEFVSESKIKGSIYDLGWYPGLKLDDLSEVEGDIFKVNQYQLERLDSYEGCPSLYSRRRVETLRGEEVFVYEYNGSVHPDDRIEDGDWLSYAAKEKV